MLCIEKYGLWISCDFNTKHYFCNARQNDTQGADKKNVYFRSSHIIFPVKILKDVQAWAVPDEGESLSWCVGKKVVSARLYF